MRLPLLPSIVAAAVFTAPLAAATYPGPAIPTVPTVIEAENFDTDGAGVAYHDNTAGNWPGSAYRTSDVDIAGINGGHALCAITAGEWTAYTIDVPSAGSYSIIATYSSQPGGTCHFEINGSSIGSLALASTGSYHTYQTRTLLNIPLAAGTQKLSFHADSAGFNLDKIEIVPYAEPAPEPYNASPIALPGVIEAEDFDLGGAGIAYHDTTGGNWPGSAYRASDVDIATGNGGHVLCAVVASEWTGYTVDVAASGQYSVLLTYSGGGTSNITIDGTDFGNVGMANTGSYFTYQTRAVLEDITLSAGEQFLEFTAVSAGFNLDSIEVIPYAPAPPPSPTPYAGVISVPSQVIEAENFDNGGEGVAYHDTTGGNWPGSAYRTSDVDIAAHNGGHVICATANTEWVTYSIDVEAAGDYDVLVTYSSHPGANATITLDGDDYAVGMPTTNGYGNYIEIAAISGITLAAGENRLTFTANSAGFNLDSIRLVDAVPAVVPVASSFFDMTPVLPQPGEAALVLEAGEYDLGGDGLGHHDSTGANLGGQVRAGSVDLIMTTVGTDEDGDPIQSDVAAYIAGGEWLGYTVDVPAPLPDANKHGYDICVNVAVASSARMHIEYNDGDETRSIFLPFSGGYYTYRKVLFPALYLEPGVQQIKIVFDQPGLNFDSVEISARSDTSQVARTLDTVISNMGYYEYLPPGYFNNPDADWPIVVMLGGAGERGNGVSQIAKAKRHGPPYLLQPSKIKQAYIDRYPAICLAPQTPIADWNSNFLNLYIEEMQRTYRIDESRQYFTGLCMGGTGAMRFAIAYPEQVAAVVPCIIANLDPQHMGDAVGIPTWFTANFRDNANTWHTPAWARVLADSYSPVTVPSPLEHYPYPDGGEPNRDVNGIIIGGTGTTAPMHLTAKFDGTSWANPWLPANDDDPWFPSLADVDDAEVILTLFKGNGHGSGWKTTYDKSDRVWDWVFSKQKGVNN